MFDPLGLYISVPFCRAKCTFCNFASDSFAPSRIPEYTEALCRETSRARDWAHSVGAELPSTADSVYLGGGTPSLLPPAEVHRLFATLRHHFSLIPDAEITVEAAPGQISAATLDAFLLEGVNRISLGVQSFVDAESAAVGRLHTRQTCLDEIARLRSAGIQNLSLDLIAGLPHQTPVSWQWSVEQAIDIGVPHLSVYLLEVDEDSRLGHEILDGGGRYSAAATPSDDEAADAYTLACDLFDSAGIRQYEISNFARAGFESRHNLRYWQRKPYLGLGLDAHSMLQTDRGTAIRFANPDDLDTYLNPEGGLLPQLRPADPKAIDRIDAAQAFEESLFLGLRLNSGVDLKQLSQQFDPELLAAAQPSLDELVAAGLLACDGSLIHLTPHGRLVSNEVFSRLLIAVPA